MRMIGEEMVQLSKKFSSLIRLSLTGSFFKKKKTKSFPHNYLYESSQFLMLIQNMILVFNQILLFEQNID